MNKIFTLTLALAISGTASADKLTMLSFGLPEDEVMMMQPISLGMSPNGKYVCGVIYNGNGFFIGDTEINEMKFIESTGDDGGELRGVSDTGLAIGYNGTPGITYSFEDGIETELACPKEYTYVLGEAITSDGSLLVGSLVAFTSGQQRGAYSTDGKEWKMLPIPSDDELGAYAGMGSTAKYVNGDGKYILGTIGNNIGPSILWVRNDAGEYEIDPIFSKYVVMSREELEAGEKEIMSLTPANISNNGKYAVFKCMLTSGAFVPAYYDTETKTMNVNKELQPIDGYGMGLTLTAVANDGTMIGYIGSIPFYESGGSFILKPGETQAVSFSEAFPSYEEVFYYSESVGFNDPTAISADGRYILGYAFYSPDFNDPNVPAYYTSYIIDTETTSAIKDINAGTAADAVPAAYYNLQGQRVSEMTKGVNIVRMSDGSVRKIIK